MSEGVEHVLLVKVDRVMRFVSSSAVTTGVLLSSVYSVGPQYFLPKGTETDACEAYQPSEQVNIPCARD